MVLHRDLPGLNVRLSDSREFFSCFSEAQDALLAASIDELQSENVLGSRSQRRLGSRNAADDCWMEFRAYLKQPSGFFNHNPNKRKGKVRVAKAPDLPYE